MSQAYYNEIDPFAAEWLRKLITAGHIAPGVVDERSIEDVKPEELREFTQCHFFAGIGVWSYALRRAGWPDDRPVWTGSCPCQPFSSSGKGGGFDDERHLWPALHWHVAQCRPVVVFGEQVASRDGQTWFDLVQSDLEGEEYTVGVVSSVACGFGAPHKRQRLYWVAESDGARQLRACGSGDKRVLERSQRGRHAVTDVTGSARELAIDATGERCAERWGPQGVTIQGKRTERSGEQARPEPSGELSGRPAGLGGAGELVNDDSNGRDKGREGVAKAGCNGLVRTGAISGPHPTNGHWSGADWLGCRDGKFRAVESGTFPLVNGAPNRVGRLRGYGNAIVASQAEEFIKSYMESK